MASTGQRIQQARLTAGLTQSQLARAIETGDRNVQRWESGANEPSVRFVAAIARATGRPFEFFVAEDDAPFPEAA